MSDELNKLEREVEAAMASLPADFSVEVPAALLMRVKAAVRHEVNEEWLVGQASPLPSARMMQRVHEAVRQELEWRATVRHPAWGRMMSALAAAAMIALSVGLIHKAGTLKKDALVAGPDVVEAQQHLDRFMAAAEQVFAADSLTESIYDDLSTVEEDIASWHSTGGESETGGLGDVVREIDSNLTDAPKAKGVSGLPVVSKGVLG